MVEYPADKERYADCGWLGHQLEKVAKNQIYNAGIMIDFRQWSDANDNQTLKEQFNFPFDEGFGFWPITERVYGGQVDSENQSVGNCVPYGACLANVDRIAVELLLFGESERPFIPFVPFSYGAGRVYVGNVNWSSHGSLGSWQIAADMRYGMLPTDTPNLPIRFEGDIQGSANTNSTWMKSKGVLDSWQPFAKALTVGEGSNVESFDQLKIAVCDKKQPATIASDWGFVSKGLDSKYGIVVHGAGGSWAHQMHIRGVFSIKGQWFVNVGNQWGYKYHPLIGEGYAKGGFVIPAELFDRWVKDAECFVRGSINGRTFKPNFSFL